MFVTVSQVRSANRDMVLSAWEYPGVVKEKFGLVKITETLPTWFSPSNLLVV